MTPFIMDPGTAVGVVSLGIQVCQGLLAYYEKWKSYGSDIADAYTAIADLEKTFALLGDTLQDKALDQERVSRVGECLQSCEDALATLSAEAQKLQPDAKPSKLTQKIKKEVLRLQYPLKAETLVKLKNTVAEIQSRLQIAVQILQLDITLRSHSAISQVNERTASILAQQKSNQYKKIIDWLKPPDLWSSFDSAKQVRQLDTGDWLLQSHTYNRWKTKEIRHVWLSGKPGCGKSVLCSTAIEDVQAYRRGNDRVVQFYFTFSDKRKQKYEDLLRSLIAQLGSQEPTLTDLGERYQKRADQSEFASSKLEEILISIAQSWQTVYLVIDALDESPDDDDDARYTMLQGLEKLSSAVPSLKIFATSREVREIKEAMEEIGAWSVPLAISAVNADIMRYVASQLTEDKRLSRLDEATKNEIGKTFSEKADGM